MAHDTARKTALEIAPGTAPETTISTLSQGCSPRKGGYTYHSYNPVTDDFETLRTLKFAPRMVGKAECHAKIAAMAPEATPETPRTRMERHTDSALNSA